MILKNNLGARAPSPESASGEIENRNPEVVLRVRINPGARTAHTPPTTICVGRG